MLLANVIALFSNVMKLSLSHSRCPEAFRDATAEPPQSWHLIGFCMRSSSSPTYCLLTPAPQNVSTQSIYWLVMHVLHSHFDWKTFYECLIHICKCQWKFDVTVGFDLIFVEQRLHFMVHSVLSFLYYCQPVPKIACKCQMWERWQ